MIKYLGSKRKLIPWIIDIIDAHCPGATSILDLFSGTSRVGLALKERGFGVIANDHNSFAYQLARCYIETGPKDLPSNFNKIIEHLNALPGQEGFFTQRYCLEARFFHPKNGVKIDAIRSEIDELDISDRLRSVLLVSLMEAADRVDSTCGIQMAYLKAWAKRAHNPLVMRIPHLVDGAPGRLCRALCLEAHMAAQGIDCDVAYLDPPYNQHSYRGNYHIWETLVCFDGPEVYGTANKRIDCRHLKSDFNSKRTFKNALKKTIESLSAKFILISFNDEGFISQEELETLVRTFGKTQVFSVDYKRYIGAQIGIYNPDGVKVGNINKLRNKELIYVIDRR